MILTDKEKLIISALYLQKQLVYTIPLDVRTRMIQDYSIALEVVDVIDLYNQIQIEEMNFITMLTMRDLPFYELQPSNFSNREKYITYQTELGLVVGDMPFPVKAEFANKIGSDLNIKDTVELLTAMSKQINELADYISYYLKTSQKL